MPDVVTLLRDLSRNPKALMEFRRNKSGYANSLGVYDSASVEILEKDCSHLMSRLPKEYIALSAMTTGEKVS